MKNTLPALALIVLCLATAGCDCRRTDAALSASLSADTPRTPTWRETLQRYREDDDVGQIMLVRHTGGSQATVSYYVKNRTSNNAWELVFEERGAYVGRNGIGKTREGDAKTPVGTFRATCAFGILNNPGTALEWIDITPDTYSCDEDGPYYNRIIHTRQTGHACTGERMYAYSPEYNYGLALNYNENNVYPEGSAIYLHCKGVNPFTGGCIALTQEHMKLVLTSAAPGFTVCIGKN